MPNNLVEVAKLGRCVGLHGALRCQILTDFPEIFKTNRIFFTILPFNLKMIKEKLTIKNFFLEKKLIEFQEITTPEMAKTLSNKFLYSTIEDTRAFCHLKKEEFFWFDVIGCKLVEENLVLGIVKEIQRIANIDYLVIQTHQYLASQHAKTFLLPYLEQFILKLEIDSKIIYTKNAKSILEAS